MRVLSSGAVVLTFLLSLPSPSAAQLTCNPEQLNPASYRLTTEAQALNLKEPRLKWWNKFFDPTLEIHRDALDDLNDGALTIAEHAVRLDERNLLGHSQIARQLVVTGEDGTRARAVFKKVFDAQGAVVWPATLYDVEARDFFLMAFDRAGIHVFRFGEAVGKVERHLGVPEYPGPEAMKLWRALGGCVEDLKPEAMVPWSDVSEIKAGNYVLYFKFNKPVMVSSDRGKRKTLREFKVALHGAMGTVEYRVTPGRDRWDEPSVNGVGIGPTAYQDRVRRTLAAVIDPEGRIKLPKASRGAGW